MATEVHLETLQNRVRELESELARQKSRNNVEGFRYERRLMLREFIIWGLAMAFLMCFIRKVI